MIVVYIGTHTTRISEIRLPTTFNTIYVIDGTTTDNDTLYNDTYNFDNTIDSISMYNHRTLCDSVPDISLLDDIVNPATERMVMMGRVFSHHKHKNHCMDVVVYNRRAFSKSGYLPKRIRRKKK